MPLPPVPNTPLVNPNTGQPTSTFLTWLQLLYNAVGGALVVIDVSSNTVISTSSNTAISLAKRFARQVDPKDYGAKGDGSTDDTNPINLAIAAAVVLNVPIHFSSGTYKITGNLTFSRYVIIDHGAILNIASGKTLTFQIGIEAGIYQIFSGSGSVVVSPKYTPVGYPEWFNGSIQSCINSCQVTQLQAQDYTITATINITSNNKILRGVNSNYVVGACSRILLNSATLDGIFCGSLTDPGSINSFITGIQVHDVLVVRLVPVTPPASGHETSAPAGLRCQYLLYGEFRNVVVYEHSLGFAYANCVQLKSYKCQTNRSVAGNSATNDIYWGYCLNGAGTYGLNSNYWEDCVANTAIAAPTGSTIGFSCPGRFGDTFLLRCEADQFQYGIVLDGTGATSSYDGHIMTCVFDQCTVNCMQISNLPTATTLSVVDCYAAPSSAGNAGIYISSSTGQVSLTNNQVIGVTSTTASGYYFTSVSNITGSGNMVSDSSLPVSFISSTNCDVQIAVHNTTVAATQAAILLTSSTHNKINCVIKGDSAGRFPIGVNLTNTGCTYNEINCSSIDEAAITGGASNKLVYNGTQITDIKMFGTGNISSGLISTSQNTVLPNNLTVSGMNSVGVVTTNSNGLLSTNTYLPAGEFPALTGDVTTSAGSLATTLATVNTNTGTWGDGTHVGQFTVNGKGLITGASSVLITGASPTGTAGGDLGGTYPNPTVTGLTHVSGKIEQPTAIADSSGNNVLGFTYAGGSPTDYFTFSNGTSNNASLAVTSSNTNASWSLNSKGTGGVVIGTAGNATVPVAFATRGNQINLSVAALSSTRTLTYPDGDVTLVAGTMATNNLSNVTTSGDVTNSNAAITIANNAVTTAKINANACTLSKLDASTATANKVLMSGSSASPTWSTPTFPNASATSGKFIRSDGTNWVASTPTFPTSAGSAGKILASDGTNYVESTPTFPYSASATSRKITVSDGTNWVASTETWAVPGSSGNVLVSDGTNWTANARTGTSNVVFSNSPTLVTPTIGAASATSINFGGTSLANYVEGTWTPNDASGANLVFTGASGSYTRIGNLVVATGQFVYPTTVDGSAAIIGGLPISGGGTGKNGGEVIYTTASTATKLLMNAGGGAGTTAKFFTAAGAAITNATLTGATFYVQIIYHI